MNAPLTRNRPPQHPTTRWEDLLDRLTLRVLAMARGMTRHDESVWTSFSKKSASRYVTVRLGVRGAAGNTFIIRVSDHPLDPQRHRRDFQFEIIVAQPTGPEDYPVQEEDLEFYLKSSQTRSAVRASRRQLAKWLSATRDRRDGRLPAVRKRNCHRPR